MIKLLKIGQKASQKEVFAWNILGSLAYTTNKFGNQTAISKITLKIYQDKEYWIDNLSFLIK